MKTHKKWYLLSSLYFMSFSVMSCSEQKPIINNSEEYLVTFSDNYEGCAPAKYVQVKKNETIAKPDTDPVRNGFIFAGWSTDSYGLNLYDFSLPVTDNLRLFAGWTLTNATVTFQLNNGQDPLKVVVNVGDKVTRPEDPTRDNYQFDGWYKDASLTTPFDFNMPISKNTSIYAKWKQNAATVTLVLYDDVRDTAVVNIGETLARPENPTREDYAFVDWYTDYQFTKVYDFSTTVKGDFTLYAKWELTVATVTFDPNYQDAALTTVKVNVGEYLTKPEDPVREGFNFINWYTEVATTNEFLFTTPITENITLYGKWDAKLFTVTFDLNYEGSTSTTSQVAYLSTVSEPEDPVRTNYTFVGWYTSPTENTVFSFDTAITCDTTIYAHWQENKQEDDGIIDFTWNYNYGNLGVYTTTQSNTGFRIKTPADPSRDKYYFAGWSTAPDSHEIYDFKSNRATEDMTFYACWMKMYTFEAEWTDLTNKPGQGSSDNCSGTALIQYISDVPGNGAQMGISNGAYVGKLYYNGAYLQFDVNASKAMNDVIICLRLSPDLFDMYFTDNEYQVQVNGTKLSYGTLGLYGAIAQDDVDEQGNYINGDMNKRPFENYFLDNATASLNKGFNTIKLVTNNTRDHGGTFNAETPLVDCMYLCSYDDITWENVYTSNTNQTDSDIVY